MWVFLYPVGSHCSWFPFVRVVGVITRHYSKLAIHVKVAKVLVCEASMFLKICTQVLSIGVYQWRRDVNLIVASWKLLKLFSMFGVEFGVRLMNMTLMVNIYEPYTNQSYCKAGRLLTWYCITSSGTCIQSVTTSHVNLTWDHHQTRQILQLYCQSERSKSCGQPIHDYSMSWMFLPVFD